MAKPTGNIRMGIVSFITLVSVLLLAVLSVLCVTTANASRATAQRQAASADALYEVDAAGQRALAAVDGYLAQSRANGEKPAEAVARIAADVEGTLAAAAQDGQSVAVSAPSGTAGVAEIDLAIDNDAGHELDAKLTINNDLSYSVAAWKTSVAPSETESTSGLWGGTSNQNSN